MKLQPLGAFQQATLAKRYQRCKNKCLDQPMFSFILFISLFEVSAHWGLLKGYRTTYEKHILIQGRKKNEFRAGVDQEEVEFETFLVPSLERPFPPNDTVIMK